MSNFVRIQVILSKYDRKKLRDLAYLLETSISALVRSMVRGGIKDLEKNKHPLPDELKRHK